MRYRLPLFALLVLFSSFQWATAQDRYSLPVEIIPAIGHSGAISSISVSPDGTLTASTGSDGATKLWHLESGQLLRTLGGAYAVRFLPDGSSLVTGGDNGFELWDAATGNLLRKFEGHTDRVMGLAVALDGKTVASASFDKTIKIWDVASGDLLHTLRGHKGFVVSVAFSPDARLLVSGSADRTIRIWDLTQASPKARTIKAHSREVSSVAFSPDGSVIASASWDKTIRLWDVKKGARLATFRGHTDRVHDVIFSPDGSALLSASDDKTMRLWNIATGDQTWVVTDEKRAFNALAFSPDALHVLSAGSIPQNFQDPDQSPKLWDARSGELRRAFVPRPGLIAARYSSEGMEVLVAELDAGRREVHDDYWDRATGRLLRTTEHDYASHSPNGRLQVFLSKQMLEVRDSGSGRILHRLIGHSAQVLSTAFSPDSRLLATTGFDNTIRIWDLTSGSQIGRIDLPADNASSALAFSPNGRLLAFAGTNPDVAIWEVSTRKLVTTFQYEHKDVWGGSSIAFSPDGSEMVVGNFDGDIRVWEVASGKLVRTLVGHLRTVGSIEILPSRDELLSSSDDGTMRVWRTSTGELLATTIVFENHEWVTITPEGFFDASEHGAEKLTIVRGLQVYSIDQAYQALYRPDLVQAKLAGDAEEKVKAAAANLDLSAVIDSGPAPAIAFLSPEDGTTLATDQVNVEALLSDQGGGIGRVEWRVNGVTVGVATRGLERVAEEANDSSQPPTSLQVKQNLTLDSGDNRIEVVAYNAGNLIASLPAVLNLNSEGSSSAEPRLFVLAAGVNDYWDSRLRLTFAASDAKAIADALGQAGKDLYESVDVTTLLDSDVTATKLSETFSALSAEVRATDVFVFFLAGHGKTEDGRYYFIPQDFEFHGEHPISDAGIGQDQWQEWFASIRARQTVLLYDTCESGSLSGTGVAQRGIERVVAIDKMTRAFGRTILTAATDDTPALEGYRGHGVFTYALLDGLAKSDANGDRLVAVTELAGYVNRIVPEVSYAAFRYRQLPQMNLVGSDFSLVGTASVLPASVQAETTIPVESTDVIIAPTKARKTADSASVVVIDLPPGTQVRVMETAAGWALVARQGKLLGYVESTALAKLQ